ncbi:hypothetical protein QW060_25600 [Myroides ceti]|uniref:Uncharacterized protein n=1 Tax=Paenimyroides ceti TaxID=395087 RepID=A0ABT8D0B4_9FLAO|nr:hypothetical protein [Paenimyroides ceti]MDN3710239.1 hypothetical protein [Paenimyroides ceti]
MINIVGHTHPGISIRTKQRHYFRLPCFYFDKGVFILPAFGDLTGLYIMERKRGDEVFIVLGDEVKRLKKYVAIFVFNEEKTFYYFLVIGQTEKIKERFIRK